MKWILPRRLIAFVDVNAKLPHKKSFYSADIIFKSTTLKRKIAAFRLATQVSNPQTTNAIRGRTPEST